MKVTRILSADEIRQLTRVHAHIGALLASNGVATSPGGRPKAKSRAPRDGGPARLRGRGDFGPADR